MMHRYILAGFFLMTAVAASPAATQEASIIYTASVAGAHYGYGEYDNDGFLHLTSDYAISGLNGSATSGTSFAETGYASSLPDHGGTVSSAAHATFQFGGSYQDGFTTSVANAGLSYTFEIVGPKISGQAIPVTINSLESISGVGSAQAVAGIAIYDGPVSQAGLVYSRSVGSNFNYDFDNEYGPTVSYYSELNGNFVEQSTAAFGDRDSLFVTQSLAMTSSDVVMLHPNRVYTLEMGTYSDVNLAQNITDFLRSDFGLNNSPFIPECGQYGCMLADDPRADNLVLSGGDAYGYVDPSITIDPAYASQYQVYGGLLGPPIPAASGTPEPATWALLVAGFGLVGAAVRRRRVTA